MQRGRRKWRKERGGGETKEKVEKGMVMVVCDSNSDSGSSGSEVIVIVAVIKVGVGSEGTDDWWVGCRREGGGQSGS